MPTYNRIAAVTGGNKGIGFACVRQLALQYPQSSFNSGPLLIYLTARNKERGEQALQSILQDPQLKRHKALRSDGGLADIQYLPLDIDSEESIQEFANQIKQKHPDGFDILINNAAIALDGFNIDIVRKTLHCNYYGTMAATNLLLPHVRDGGRVVNVSSSGGQLNSKYSGPIRKRFLDSTTTDQITKLMEEFTSAVDRNDYKNEWPGAAYSVSKAGIIGMTRAIALENARTGSKTLINTCDPGYVNTDMSKGNGIKTPDEGSKTLVLLALGDIHGSNGEFWSNERITPWER